MKDFTLNKLSAQFYTDHPEGLFPEFEHKPSRPYVVLLVKIGENRFALPFRTNIRHNYCYKFSNTGRITDSVTGIDFTKAVIVNNQEYIGIETDIDDKEYIELSRKYYFIIDKFKKYLEGYTNYIKNGGNEFTARKYQFSTLKYYHMELGL